MRQSANKADKVVLGGRRVGACGSIRRSMWPTITVTHCKEINCITSHASTDVFLFLTFELRVVILFISVPKLHDLDRWMWTLVGNRDCQPYRMARPFLTKCADSHMLIVVFLGSFDSQNIWLRKSAFPTAH
jgi:hypothetical protein